MSFLKAGAHYSNKMFEIKAREGLGRIGRFSVNNKSIITPNIAVVVNPNNQLITPRELYDKFKADLIITNAYIINRSKFKDDILNKGLHKHYDFPGLIYTDSGTYQMFSKGEVGISNEETVNLQKKLGSDIITPLDLFTLPTDNKKNATSKLVETIKRFKQASKLASNIVYPIQGGSFIDLRVKACKEAYNHNPLIHAIGGIVPLMINYDFKRLIELILNCKQSLPAGTPIHAFGAGHPIIFSLLVLAGVDLFDSASYALYAHEGRYLTELGTRIVKELQFLPCNCPVCSSNKAIDLVNDESLLARHNLYVIMREINQIREAIHDNKLFDLVSSRVRAHPNLYYAYKWLLEQKPFNESDPITKSSALFWTGELSNLRPELLKAKARLKEIGFKSVPKPFRLIYPFGQSEGIKFDYSKKDYDDLSSIRLIADYQLGLGAGSALFPEKTRIVYTSNNRINQLWLDNELLCILRASDGHLIIHKAGALRIKKFLKKVTVKPEVAEFPEKGGNVFAKHVIKSSPNIKPGEEVLVMSAKPIAIGEALLNSREMKEFKQGVAVIVREGI